MKDYTLINKKTGATNANENLPEQWNDCSQFDYDKDSYGCQGIVRKTDSSQLCRRCREAKIARELREGSYKVKGGRQQASNYRESTSQYNAGLVEECIRRRNG